MPRLTHNDDSWTLPLPATFVIDQHAIIRSADVSVDYRNRAESAQTVEILKRLRTRTERKIALAILQEGYIEACLESHVPLLVFFWSDPALYRREAHRCGSKVFIQVGSVQEAIAVVEAVTPVSVIAAGGISLTSLAATHPRRRHSLYRSRWQWRFRDESPVTRRRRVVLYHR